MKYILSALSAVMFLTSCMTSAPSPGVPVTLALERRQTISDVRYELSFDIPECRDSIVPGNVTASFKCRGKNDVILDFKVPEDHLKTVTANGRAIRCGIRNEHIVIPGSAIIDGDNTIAISFRSGDLSLNRRDDFLYTLLVPDRARTLFPCFDQPDLKATYSLSLTVPADWTAVSNTSIKNESPCGNGRKKVDFNDTEPLSTYLFSFVAGVFERVAAERGGRTISIYHRENDPSKRAQCPVILDIIFDALAYMEDYTGMPYPFAKYDCIAIPDFQYGGMEHTGATLYNARSLFLEPSPTTDELQDRASLIAHETAHMWFGDCVTMKWFDDVWTKEVFANWFAAKIIRPSFPGVNHKVSDLRNYFAASYEEDRTAGSNAIWRPLDNLENAGLIYGNIIYDKAPIVMEKLYEAMGAVAFRDGIREYVREYAYSNAGWDDLIAILERHADFDVAEWSRVWIKEKGMPVYFFNVNGGKAEITADDPFGNGNVWQQNVACDVEDGKYAVPNPDGAAYGCFVIDTASYRHICSNFRNYGDTGRMSLLMTLYENAWRGCFPEDKFLEWCSGAMPDETNPLILESMTDYGADVFNACEGTVGASRYIGALRKIAFDTDRDPEIRLIAFRRLYRFATDGAGVEELFTIWDNSCPPEGLTLGENDYTEMAYRLMMRMPGRYRYIKTRQREAISNPDRLETFDYVCRAVSPDRSCRDSLFASMLQPSGRRPEPRVLKALGFLCDPSAFDEADTRIRPALDILPEVQKYGDIFFPSSWCMRLLSAQRSEMAAAEVRSYIDATPDLNPLLRSKVLQAAGRLLK